MVIWQADLGSSQQTIVSVQSVPSSPHQLPSILSPLPSLEFTINSQQVNSYLNGLQSGALNSSSGGSPGAPPLNQNSNILSNIVQYRNGGMSQGMNGESLPPSPQSQQSCFNSPQGSPGPLSISPQDLNPFTTQNYDIMQKKFDSINLEAGQQNYNNSVHQQQHHQQQQQHYNNNFVLASPPHPSSNMSGGSSKNAHNSISSDNTNANNSSNSNDGSSTNVNESLNTTESIESDIGAFVLNSRSDSISSNSSSSGNQNNDFNEIELQNLNSSYKNNDPNNNSNSISNSNKTNKINDANNSNCNTSNSNNNNNSNIINMKAHKNSIPNIILTYSGGEWHNFLLPFFYCCLCCSLF